MAVKDVTKAKAAKAAKKKAAPNNERLAEEVSEEELRYRSSGTPPELRNKAGY